MAVYHSIVVFGTSITRGSFDSVGGGWVSRLSAYVDARIPPERGTDIIEVYNLGISGDTSRGVRERFASELTPRADGAEYSRVTVLLEVGGNDALFNTKTNTHWVEPAEYIANVEACVAEVKRRGFRIVLLGLHKPDEERTNPIPWDPECAYRWSDCKVYDDALQTIAAREQLLYIPQHDILGPEHLLDGDHPNAKGHQLIFERIKEYLEKANII
ncbi:MAG: GDSL-type esterase/lipase family protein [Patescibacteria group bacterium]|mgnify:FL=1